MAMLAHESPLLEEVRHITMVSRSRMSVETPRSQTGGSFRAVVDELDIGGDDMAGRK